MEIFLFHIDFLQGNRVNKEEKKINVYDNLFINFNTLFQKILYYFIKDNKSKKKIPNK